MGHKSSGIFAGVFEKVLFNFLASFLNSAYLRQDRESANVLSFPLTCLTCSLTLNLRVHSTISLIKTMQFLHLLLLLFNICTTLMLSQKIVMVEFLKFWIQISTAILTAYNFKIVYTWSVLLYELIIPLQYIPVII